VRDFVGLFFICVLKTMQKYSEQVNFFTFSPTKLFSFVNKLFGYDQGSVENCFNCTSLDCFMHLVMCL